jgi:hypothetical protein
MNLVSQWNARTATATIAEIARNPNCINLRIECCIKECFKILSAPSWGVGSVVGLAAICVRVEDVRKAHVSEVADKAGGRQRSSLPESEIPTKDNLLAHDQKWHSGPPFR